MRPAIRRARALVAALGLCLAASAQAQEAVESSPRRILGAAEQMAFRGVGRLDFGAGYCTATLFDERHALTAAHCLYDETGRLRPAADLWFRAGLRGDGQQAVRQVRRAVPHPAYRWNGPEATLEDISADLAMVELDQPLLTTEFPNYLPGDLPPPGGAVALLSYGQGRDRALSLQAPCRVLQRRGAVAQLDCEADPGSSGSPVLVRDAGGALRLVGVISAKGRRLSYAAAVSDALPGLRWAMERAGPRRSPAPGFGAGAITTNSTGGAPVAGAGAGPGATGGGGPGAGLSPGRSGGWKSVRPPTA
ncbi:MAG: trypsin-like serine protease [Pseudomonadota bacterium]|nr:trypsin-like serine protease [Pseudomonadota bacterium]